MNAVLKLVRWGDAQSRCEAVKQWGSREVSAGHLREVPRSHLHPFVTIPSSRDTAVVENKGNVWDVGTGSIPWGKANYGLKAPVCGMQLR